MNTIKTKSGFEYQVEEDAMDDLEVFDAIRAASDPDLSGMEKTAAFFRAFQGIIGDEQDKALREYLKEKNGKVKTSDYRKEIDDFFTNLNKPKKK